MNIFRRFWDWTMGLDAPVHTEQTLIASAPTLLTGLSQERYPDANQRRTAERDARHYQVASRICAINNSQVTRDQGVRTMQIKKPYVEPLSHEELVDARDLILCEAANARLDRH
jgi:hypothetical protein